MVGESFGFHIGLNIITAVLVGFLGLPGAGLLILLKIILRIKKLFLNKFALKNIYKINLTI
jgi:hypothetical protein